MKIFYYLIVLTIATVTLSSCTSTGTQNKRQWEMTQTEELRLINLARRFILRSKKIATPAERQFIKTTAPTVDVLYEGYKRGKTTITWNTDRRKIVARLFGSMVGENHKWRISVYFKEQIKYTPRSQKHLKPIRQGGIKDFSAMFRNQAVITKPKGAAPKPAAK
jgi:hypothetical protein